MFYFLPHAGVVCFCERPARRRVYLCFPQTKLRAFHCCRAMKGVFMWGSASVESETHTHTHKVSALTKCSCTMNANLLATSLFFKTAVSSFFFPFAFLSKYFV